MARSDGGKAYRQEKRKKEISRLRKRSEKKARLRANRQQQEKPKQAAG